MVISINLTFFYWTTNHFPFSTPLFGGGKKCWDKLYKNTPEIARVVPSFPMVVIGFLKKTTEERIITTLFNVLITANVTGLPFFNTLNDSAL